MLQNINKNNLRATNNNEKMKGFNIIFIKKLNNILRRNTKHVRKVHEKVCPNPQIMKTTNYLDHEYASNALPIKEFSGTYQKKLFLI